MQRRRRDRRIPAGAPTSPQIFDLRCELREQSIAFLQARYPQALPRLRFDPPPQPANTPIPSGAVAVAAAAE